MVAIIQAMPLVKSPSSSTRLENLSFEPEGARLEVDGQKAWIREESEPGSVGVLRKFYDQALADFRVAQAAEKPGWFSRLRAWFGRVFSKPLPGVPPILDHGAGAVVDPAIAERAPGRGGDASPPRLRSGQARRPSAPSKKTSEPSAPPNPITESAPQKSAAGSPHLRAIFGDKEGIHLAWALPSAGDGERVVARHYSPDSALGHQLQDCYRHLAQLGFKIVGVDLQAIEGPAPAPEKPAVLPAAPAGPAKPEPTPASAPRPPSAPTLVMRLLPESKEDPDRILVEPVATPANVQALAAPERLTRALRAAASPDQPDGGRLTCLRCSLGKTGLKVTAVGFGAAREGGPERWEEIAPWLERQLEAPSEERKTKPQSAPRAVPELELNI